MAPKPYTLGILTVAHIRKVWAFKDPGVPTTGALGLRLERSRSFGLRV